MGTKTSFAYCSCGGQIRRVDWRTEVGIEFPVYEPCPSCREAAEKRLRALNDYIDSCMV